jgi:RimJ/RimL family protein N-acetyltransferase
VETFLTERLSADPVTSDDLSFLVELWSDERVGRTLGGVRNAEQVELALEEAIQHWQAHGFGRWILRRDGSPVGTIKLARCCLLGRDEVELGYALSPGAWGQGYATEAGAGALSFARKETALTEIVAFTLQTNVPSLAVMRRLGFQHEGPLDLPEGPHWLYRKQLTETHSDVS